MCSALCEGRDKRGGERRRRSIAMWRIRRSRSWRSSAAAMRLSSVTHASNEPVRHAGYLRHIGSIHVAMLNGGEVRVRVGTSIASSQCRRLRTSMRR